MRREELKKKKWCDRHEVKLRRSRSAGGDTLFELLRREVIRELVDLVISPRGAKSPRRRLHADNSEQRRTTKCEHDNTRRGRSAEIKGEAACGAYARARAYE
jgi:hypothetical protein